MPTWSAPALRILREKLAALFDERSTQKTFLTDAGWTNADLVQLSWHPAPLYCWFNILEWAQSRNKVTPLVVKLKADYPDDTDIQAMVPDLAAPAVVAPPLSSAWKGAATLEKELSSVPTLVPVYWLAQGLERARSVGRVNLPVGYGTGFLVKGSGGDLLITNHHVLDTAIVAGTSTVSFNLEELPGGIAAKPDPWSLDPTRFWTSPSQGGDDWSAVGVKPRDENGATIRATDRYGALDITPTAVSVNDRVNIIQHPGGLTKQLSCVSNVVAWVGDAEGRVQYLTDTQPGSSGSPVFDRNWSVVALHHSGGMLQAGASPSRYMRNEGIAIARVYAGLKAAGEIA